MWRLLTNGGRFLSITGLPATLGSEADNDLRLRHASILPRHARFELAPDGRLAVQALGEAVVGVGGRQVQRGTLGDGEALILGRLRFTVQRAANSPATPSPAARSGVADAAAAPPADARRAGKTAGAARAGAARAAAARRAARGSAGKASASDELFQVRDKTLRFSTQPTRRGPLNVDFAQLSGAWKAAIVLALLLVGAGLFWGASLLSGLFG